MSSQAGGGLATYLPLIIIVAAFWLLILRPQQQRAKQQKQMLSSLDVGTKIVTIGGIYATIVELGDERLMVEVADGSRFELSRRAVGAIVEEQDELAETDEADEDEPPMADDEPAAPGSDTAGQSDGDDA